MGDRCISGTTLTDATVATPLLDATGASGGKFGGNESASNCAFPGATLRGRFDETTCLAAAGTFTEALDGEVVGSECRRPFKSGDPTAGDGPPGVESVEMESRRCVEGVRAEAGAALRTGVGDGETLALCIEVEPWGGPADDAATGFMCRSEAEASVGGTVTSLGRRRDSGFGVVVGRTSNLANVPMASMLLSGGFSATAKAGTGAEDTVDLRCRKCLTGILAMPLDAGVGSGRGQGTNAGIASRP